MESSHVTLLRKSSGGENSLGRAKAYICPPPVESDGSSLGTTVRKNIRVDVPVDRCPNFDFLGNLLAREDMFKQIGDSTKGRIFIRGRGSIKDREKEKMLRAKPGFEHFNEPLHIIVEAELPVETIDDRLMEARETLEDRLLLMSSPPDFVGSQGSPSGYKVIKRCKVFILVDQCPNGDSLKEIEASTGCLVLLRGRGSREDPVEEEMLRGKPGYEHLNEKLHVLFLAELPLEIIEDRMLRARWMLQNLIKPPVFPFFPPVGCKPVR